MSARQFLLDTNAVIDILRNPQGMVARRLVENGGVDSCAISDITLYELYTGAYASQYVRKNIAAVERLTDWLSVLPSSRAYKEAARQKVALQVKEQIIEDVDILIGSTAIVSKRILVTSNTNHLGRLEGIKITDWTTEG